MVFQYLKLFWLKIITRQLINSEDRYSMIFRWSVHFKYPIYQYTNDDTDYNIQRNPHINQGAYISFSLTVTFGLIARMCCLAHLIHYKRFCDVTIKIIRTSRELRASGIEFHNNGLLFYFGNCRSHTEYI